MRTRAQVAVLVFGLAVPLGAAANPVPSVEIFDVVRRGAEVEVAVKVNDPEIEGVPLALVRWWGELQRTVWQVEDVADATLGDWTYCAQPSFAACEEAPDECEDCDEDGVPECLEGCSVEDDVISVVDGCVPPGCTWYGLEEELPQGCLGEEDMDLGLTVDDVSQDCPGQEGDLPCDPAPDCGPDADADGDSDTDTDSDSDSDADGDGDGDADGDAAQDSGDSGCRAAPARSSRGLLGLLFSL